MTEIIAICFLVISFTIEIFTPTYKEPVKVVVVDPSDNYSASYVTQSVE